MLLFAPSPFTRPSLFSVSKIKYLVDTPLSTKRFLAYSLTVDVKIYAGHISNFRGTKSILGQVQKCTVTNEARIHWEHSSYILYLAKPIFLCNKRGVFIVEHN